MKETIQKEEEKKGNKQYPWQSIDTLVGDLVCSQETSRNPIAGVTGILQGLSTAPL